VAAGTELGIGPEPPPFSTGYGASDRALATTRHPLRLTIGVPASGLAERKAAPVTIYSQHPNRGKVQLLATYHTLAGLTSTTVTSVNDTATATPIVEALNRISAYATTVLSAHDRNFHRYPTDHLDALVDPHARPSLLQGAHSLWYEYVKILLHQALLDLDEATANLPAPIRTAITAELSAEAQHFQDMPSKPDAADGDDQQRLWDSSQPAALLGGMEPLTDRYRELLNEAEKGYTAEQRHLAVESLRHLAEAYQQIDSDTCQFETEYLMLTEDPYNEQRYFVEVAAPDPEEPSSQEWTVTLTQWIPDSKYSSEQGETATGEPVLDCVLTRPPTADEIVVFLKLCADQPELLTIWAKTPVGESLSGTEFVVTKRHDALEQR